MIKSSQSLAATRSGARTSPHAPLARRAFSRLVGSWRDIRGERVHDRLRSPAVTNWFPQAVRHVEEANLAGTPAARLDRANEGNAGRLVALLADPVLANLARRQRGRVHLARNHCGCLASLRARAD